MESNEAAETEAKSNYDKFSSIKTKERATLEHQLVTSTSDLATKSKALADTQDTKDKTKAQLQADEELFADTKDSCKKRATAWSKRTSLRIQELQGFAEADTLLRSLENGAFTQVNFLQVSSISVSETGATR